MLEESHKLEIKRKLVILEDKLKSEDVGSIKHSQYIQIKRELEKLLNEPVLKIHADPNDQICESCQ